MAGLDICILLPYLAKRGTWRFDITAQSQLMKKLGKQ
jgi:hypothetical protein